MESDEDIEEEEVHEDGEEDEESLVEEEVVDAQVVADPSFIYEFDEEDRKEEPAKLVHGITSTAVPSSPAVTYDDIKRALQHTDRSTPRVLFKYERAAVLGIRASQLAKGAVPFLKTSVVDPLGIARQELEAGVLPYIVGRHLPDGTSEYWRLSELKNI